MRNVAELDAGLAKNRAEIDRLNREYVQLVTEKDKASVLSNIDVVKHNLNPNGFYAAYTATRGMALSGVQFAHVEFVARAIITYLIEASKPGGD